MFEITFVYFSLLQGVLLGLSNTAGVLAGVFGTAATGYILQKGIYGVYFLTSFVVLNKKSALS